MKREAALALSRGLGVPPLAAHVLMQRGVTTLEDGRRFLASGLDSVSDPFAIGGMTEAVSRIKRARDGNERVLVFGDYDVDGVAGTAAMVEAMRRFGVANLEWDLPHRDTGYGLDAARVRLAAEAGVALIVTVDNGITAFEAAEAARDAGIDLVITDHHSPGEALPFAAAVVNPRLDGPDHPCAHLSGAAIAYKVGVALNGGSEGIDLACLGLVADLMPLRGEVRDIVTAGLDRIRNRPRLGIAELARTARLRIERLTSENIAFQLGPRINAAGRLGDARIALELLLTEEPAVAAAHANALHAANEERRAIENAIFDDALAMAEEQLGETAHTLALASDQWHHGVIGIVAAKIQRRFNRAVVLAAFDETGLGRGSGRGMKACNLVEAFGACSGLLERFGGHGAAAGLTIRRANFEAFARDFEAAVTMQVGDRRTAPSLQIDAQVALSEVDQRLLHMMEGLQPCGHGNPSPVFCTFGAEVLPNSVQEVKGGHVKLSVKEGPHVFAAMGFSMGEWLGSLRAANKVDIAFAPSLNEWNGRTTIQLVLQDVRVLN